MRGKMERATALALGLQLNPELPGRTVIANSTVNVPIKIANGGPEPITFSIAARGLQLPTAIKEHEH
jgi:hypothetical protein